MAVLIDSLLEPAAGVVLGAAGYFCFQYWENFTDVGMYETVILGVSLSMAALLLLNLREVLDLAMSYKLCVPIFIFAILGGILFIRNSYSDILHNCQQLLNFTLLHKFYLTFTLLFIIGGTLFFVIVWKYCCTKLPTHEATVPVDNVVETTSDVVRSDTQPVIPSDPQPAEVRTEPDMIVEKPEIQRSASSEEVSTALQVLQSVKNGPDELQDTVEKVENVLLIVDQLAEHLYTVTGSNGQVNIKGRTLHYKVKGGFYRWQYMFRGEAWDEETEISVKTSRYHNERTAREQALHELVEQLKTLEILVDE